MKTKVLTVFALLVALTLLSSVSVQASLPIFPSDKPTISHTDDDDGCPDPDGDGQCDPLPVMDD